MTVQRQKRYLPPRIHATISRCALVVIQRGVAEDAEHRRELKEVVYNPLDSFRQLLYVKIDEQAKSFVQ